MKKRVLSILLCMVLLLGAVPMLGVPAQAVTYRITYNKNTSNTVENMPETTTGGPDDLIGIAEEVPIRFRYTFLGWSTDKNATEAEEVEYIPGEDIVLSSNLTLYAVWQYYTTFGMSTGYELDLTGNVGSMAEIAFTGQSKWYRIKPTQTATYNFWSTGGYDPNVTLYDSNGNQLGANDDNPYGTNDWSYCLSYSLESGSTYYIAVSGRIYSRGDSIWSWGYPGSTYRTVTYHTNIPGNDEVFIKQRQYNSTTGDIPWRIPEYEKHNFLGWATSASWDGDNLLLPGETIPQYQSYDLYAIWEEPYVIHTGATLNYYGQLEYGIKEELYTFTPKITGVYTLILEDRTDHPLSIPWVYDSSYNTLDTNTSDYDDALFKWTETYQMTAGKKYYIRVFNYNQSTIPLEKEYDEANDYAYYPNVDYTIQVVKAATLTYDANGGSGAPSSQSGSYSYKVSSVKPTRSGFTFDGWSTSRTPTTDDLYYIPGETILVNAPTTLYALWEASSYTLSYDARGGSGSPSAQSGSTSYTIPMVIPTWFGHNFTGWYTTNSSGYITDYYHPGETITITTDTVLKASWSKSGFINDADTFGSEIKYPGQMEYQYHTQIASGKYVIYSYGDEDTEGYLYDSSGKELARNDDGGNGTNFRITYNLAAGTTYYIGFKYHSSTKTGNIHCYFGPVYTVSYNSNGGSGAPAPQEKDYRNTLTLSSSIPSAPKSYTITYNANGGSVSPTSKTVNCTFSKWNTNSSGTGTSYNAGANYTNEANVTLYAQWTNPTAGTLATPTRNGYMFDGWYTSSSGGSKITSSSTISANTTVYAHWTPNPSYTVSLNPNGGSVTPTSMPVPATLPTPSKSYTITYNANGGSVSTSSKTVNCIFRNWNSNSSGSGSSYSAGTYYNVSANTTLYAQWTNPTAGTLATPSRNGYTFDGWYTASSGGNRITSSSTISANTTLYAHWTPIPTNDYTITFDAQGGSVSPTSRTVMSGTTVTLPSPSKSFTITFNANGGSVSTSSSTVYCSFRNWNSYSSGTGTSYNAGANYTVYSNTTLYAQWTNPTAGSLPSANRGGYIFDGWYTSSSGGSRITSSSTISANTTLYAHWTYIPVTAVGCDVISAPNKTSYIYKDNTDTSGTVLNIRYSDGSNKTVSDTSKMTFSGLTTSSVGTKTVSVTCEGVSASFNITVRYAWWQRLIRIFLLGFLWY